MNEKRRIANAKNAAHSTGPRTALGKRRSSLNATKHGAYARLCLDDEEVVRLKGLLLDLITYYRPSGFEENQLVKEIAKTILRKERFQDAELKALAAYRFFGSGSAQKKGDLAIALAQDAAAYSTIPRSLASEELLDKRLWGLFDRLRKLQKKRGFFAWRPPLDEVRPQEQNARALAETHSATGNGAHTPTDATPDSKGTLSAGSHPAEGRAS